MTSMKDLMDADPDSVVRLEGKLREPIPSSQASFTVCQLLFAHAGLTPRSVKPEREFAALGIASQLKAKACAEQAELDVRAEQDPIINTTIFYCDAATALITAPSEGALATMRTAIDARSSALAEVGRQEMDRLGVGDHSQVRVSPRGQRHLADAVRARTPLASGHGDGSSPVTPPVRGSRQDR